MARLMKTTYAKLVLQKQNLQSSKVFEKDTIETPIEAKVSSTSSLPVLGI